MLLSSAQFGIPYEEFCALAQKQTIVTNWHEVLADLDTPVLIYAKLRSKSEDAFLFESVEGGEKLGRYSIIGYKAIKKIQSRNENDNGYEILDKELSKYKQDEENQDLPFFHKGFVGYLSFESVQRIEASLKMQASKYPEMYMLLAGSLVVFDHVKHKLYLVSNVDMTEYQNPQKQISEHGLKSAYEKSLEQLEELRALISSDYQLPRLHLDLYDKNNHKILSQEDKIISSTSQSQIVFKSNTGKEAYMKQVEKLKEHILEGDIFQAVPSHILTANISLDPLKAYRILRTINPSPYLFLFNIKDSKTENYFSLVGSSPEMLVKCTRESKDSPFVAQIRPIAGTYPRGKSPEEDDKLSERLLSDTKEIAEHVMLVDLARNDLGRVCENGTVQVADNMIIEKYSHVLHIVSSVLGELKSEYTNKSGLELIKACFPAGTLSGAPKVKALELLSELEHSPRGPYGGCVGHIDLDGSTDTAMIIRTLFIESGQVHIQAGAGIVADSNPETEYNETLNKASALIKVVNLAA